MHGSAGIASPRIADEPAPRGSEGVERLGLLVADRECNSFCLACFSAVELDAPLVRNPRSANRRFVHDLGLAAHYCLVEDIADIAAEHPPLRKAALVAAFTFEAVCKMVRLAGPCAHALGADVEKVRGFGGRISDPA